ncbi:MAG: hypothetical protein IPL21_13930, partial [Saprospirales bacterium]|nr:hypothetical protein [Saprospirales bacterium]
MTVVKDEFLEEGKVRNLLYLCCPPVELLKKLGLYNRASSPDATVFYASFHKNVALHEIKPQSGQRVIVTTWQNVTQKPFVSFPIANNEKVKDINLLKSNKALKALKESIHPLLFDRIDSYLRFLSSEFVKSIEDRSPQRIEYFYSAFFGDRILNKKREVSVKVKPENESGEDMGNYDCILYPSVAFNHREANVAIAPKSLI